MIRCKIYTIGKDKESWLTSGLDEYAKRLKPIITFEWILAKHLEHLAQLLEKETHYICLDPKGKLFTSEEFSRYVENLGARMNFVIGGAEGLSPQIRKNAQGLISLSPLTFTHQLTRLILIEQLYRAFEIAKGSQYHK